MLFRQADICMQNYLVALLVVFTCFTGSFRSGAEPPAVPSVPIAGAAPKAVDYLVANCTAPHPTSDFWKNPNDNGVGSDQNGWQGAQGLQSIVIMYEATRDPAYLRVIGDYGQWVQHTYSGRDNLALCETWPSYDDVNCKPIGNSPSHFCIWCDDAGWVINSYLQIYQFTGNRTFLDTAYQTFVNCDKRWGVDFQSGSRGLMYYDHQDNYTMYMPADMIAGLTVCQELKKANEKQRADQCFALVSTYYNFIEYYLHSTGPGNVNITGAQFTLPKDLYQDSAHFHAGCDVPAANSRSYLGDGHFTAPQMMMAAVYVMLDACKKNHADLSLIAPQFRNFHERAVNAADAFVRPYPEGYMEPGNGLDGDVIVNVADPNVNGFGCYWWAKYVVPLNPKRYGTPLVNTARSIVLHHGTGDLSSSLWNSDSRPDGKAPDSHSTNATSGGWTFVRDASACSILAAAEWVEKTSHLRK
jgi:hypothetical protein